MEIVGGIVVLWPVKGSVWTLVRGSGVDVCVGVIYVNKSLCEKCGVVIVERSCWLIFPGRRERK
jgi:hypothetical protein